MAFRFDQNLDGDMEKTTYTLHEYDHRFDAGLAQMWNESDDQWPGTFTDGVPLTEARVREWMDRLEVLIRFVVVEESSGRVVGYGDLWDTAVRPGSAYVALLNVHPAHQGRSLARRMLVRMVDWAVDNGYDRITIGTWPANLKAMPLYKKVGFFWKPGTGVRMENYLPGVRLLPAARKYFAAHGWYETYDRELGQVEDAMTHPATGDAKVYIMRWQAGGDRLEAVYDRAGQTLTGFDNGRWSAYARAGSPEPALGLCCPFEWELQNNSEHELPVSLRAAGDPGIELAYEQAITLQPGERRVLRTEFRVASDAPRYREDNPDIPAPQVRTDLIVDGTALELGTGLRYRPAVEFSLYPAEVTLVPGQPQEVLLQLRNRSGRALRGAVRLELPPGLGAAITESSFSVEEGGYAGLPVELNAEAHGFYPLRARAEFEDGEETVETSWSLLPAAALSPAGVTGGMGDREVILENDYFRLAVKAKGGEAVIRNKDSAVEDGRVMEEIGPAFVPWDLNEQEYDLAVETAQGEVRARMSVRSTRFPGIVVGREITVNASPLIRVRGWAVNETAEDHPGLQFRPHIRAAHENRRRIAVPLRERIVVEHASQYAVVEGDLPKEPDRYAEDWLAYEYEGRVFGFVWSREDFTELDAEWGRHFFYYNLPLAAGEKRFAPPLYLYSGPGGWTAVRQAWRRIAGRMAAAPPAALPEEGRPALEIRLGDGPLLVRTGRVEAMLVLTTTRDYGLEGRVTLHPPAGWTAAPETVEFELDREHPLEARVVLTAEAPVLPGAYPGEIRVATQVFDRVEPFTLFALEGSGGAVAVESGETAGQPVWTIDSGTARWTVAPAFHGGVTLWETADGQENHLLTSFPEEGEFSWMKPFFGGLRPILVDPEADQWMGKLYEETFTTAPIEAPDACGLGWRGVQLSADVTAEDLKGLKVELGYLALPGGRLLKAVFRVFNPLPVYRRVQFGWWGFYRVDGTEENAVLHTAEYVRKRTPHVSWGVTRGWAAVENPETGRAIVSLNPDGERRILANDAGRPGAHTYVTWVEDLPPEGVVERSAFYALAETVAEAQLYGEPSRGLNLAKVPGNQP